MIEEEFSNEKKIELIEKYGPLILCSIEERFWAVNGKYIVQTKNEEIERLKNIGSLDIIYHAIDKLSNMSNAEFKELNLAPVEE